MATKGKELSELGSILSVSANTANIDGSLIVANSVTIGNSTVNTTFTATSINANTVGGNTASDLRLYADDKAANAYSNAVTYADNKVANLVNNAPTILDTLVELSNAIGNDANFFTTVTNNVANAYTNATTFASNATNISSGTLNTARLPATVNVSTLVNVGTDVNINTSAIFIGNSSVNTVVSAATITLNGVNVNTAISGNAATAYTNAAAYADVAAGTAYANAVSYANTIAGTAYSNAATYADNKAANAYSNAIAYSANATNITSGTLTANVLPTSGVTANTYGNSSAIPVITVDATGRITSATVNAVAGVTSFAYTEANNTFVISTGAGTTFAANIGTANATHTGVLKVLDSVANTNTTIAAAVSSVKTAYDAAIAANTSAASAYSNAVSYAGTIAATAYTNATSYAASIAGTAYSNGVTYTDNKAANAYSNATTFASNASNISSGTLGEARLPYRMDQNVRTTDNVTFHDAIISGNLTVNGTTVTINATELAIEDNMIYLNESTQGANTNPDLGFAGAYNDGTYRHAGFFRDASDGVWKVFDQYLPEPDASPFIDTGNTSFRIANFQANVVTAASFSGNGASVTSVNAATVGGNTAGTLRSYSDSAAATAYSNAISVASSSAATAYSNAVSYFTTNYTASDVLTKIKTVDGTGSGLDADTVDGYDASSFALKTDPEFTNDITTSSGQGRFGGWYQGTGYTGAALEVGMIGGEAYILPYNRDTSSYLNMNFNATEFEFSGQSGGFAHINTSFRAPIFYDSGNTSFYVDPASTSVLNQISVSTKIYAGGATVNSGYNGVFGTNMVGAASGNKLIYFYNDGSTLKVDAYDYGTSSSLGFTIGGNGGTVNLYTGATVAGSTIWHAGNDGSGSGLDADTVDGVQASSFAQLSGATFTGDVQINSGWGAGTYNEQLIIYGTYPSWTTRSTTSDTGWLFHTQSDGAWTLYSIAGATTNNWTQRFTFTTDGTLRNGGTSGSLYWHAGNDGSGSGLDADTLDGSGWTSGQNVSFGEIRGTDGAFGNQGILASGYPLTVYDSQRYMLGMRNSGADANYVWLAHDTWNSTSALVLHFDSVGDRFTFNEGGIGSAAGDFRAPIFYDSGSTNYYVDPASGSVLGGNLSLYLGIGTGDNVRDGLRTYDTTSMAAGVGGQLVLGYKYTSAGDYTEGAIIKMFKEDGTSGNYGSGLKFQVRDHAENLGTRLWLYPSGFLYTDQSMRAPIFYDSDDTGYYFNPASTSKLNLVAGTLMGALSGAPDSTIWCISGDYQNWGIFYNEDSPDFIEFRSAGSTTSKIGLDSGGIQSSVFYDIASTGYYIDPASTSNIRKTNIVAAGSGWDDALNIYSSDGSNRWNLLVDDGASDAFRIAYNNSERLNFATGGAITVAGDLRSPIYYDSNDTTFYTDPNGYSRIRTITRSQDRFSSGSWYPLGHYATGETVFEIDPTWTTTELRTYFNSSAVDWVADSTAPGGYAISIVGGASVGGVYSSGFPFIPVEQDDIFYMECWIKDVSGTNGHYMGSMDFNQNLSSLGGNPGSFGYWVMSNSFPGTSWTKVSGYIGGFGSSVGQFVSGTKYWTPQALFNYNGGGTSYISGWKVTKVNKRSRQIIQATGFAAATVGTYQLQIKNDISSSASADLAFGADGSYGYIQSFNSKPLLLNDQGNIVYAGDFRPTIVYDRNDTGYYSDPASTSLFNATRHNSIVAGTTAGLSSMGQIGIYSGGSPYISFHSGTTSRTAYFQETSGRFYCGEVDYTESEGSFRSPLFYDVNDTNYYGDFASTSRMNDVRPTKITRAAHAQGFLEGSYNNVGGNSYYSNPIYTIGSSYNPTDSSLANMYGVGYSHPNFWGGGKGDDWGMYVAMAGGVVGTFGCSNGSTRNTWIQGYGEATASWRAPIFYDSNDTNYYIDPTSTTSLRTVGSWRSDSGTWDGEFSGKIQYHSSYWYFQALNGWLFRNSAGSNVTTIDSSGNLTASGRVSTGTNFYADANYGYGLVGLYASTRFQGVFAMGDAYKLSADGTSVGSLYGIAWSYPSAGGPASNLASHGMLILENGGFKGAWGGGKLVTPGEVVGTLFRDYDSSGYYLDPASTSVLNAITAAGTYGRTSHNIGHLLGGYNNIGASDGQTSPIYTIGSNYNPSTTTLSNMYGIGFTTSGSFFPSGASGWGLYVASDGNARIFLSGGNGAITATGNITAYASDKRLKTNIKPITNALDKLMKINGVEFDWVENISEIGFQPQNMHETGVIAQEIQAVIPDAVTLAPFNKIATDIQGVDNEYLTVDKEKIVPLLIEAIKDQQKIIESQSKEISEIKEMLKSLSNK